MLTDTYHRETVSAEKGYRARKAAELFASHACLRTVEIHERRGGLADARPRDESVAVYVMATSGVHGRSSEVRLHPRAEERAREERERRAIERLWASAPGVAELRDELAGGGCYRIWVDRRLSEPRLMLAETLHDVGGSMSWEVRSVEDVRRLIDRPGHDAAYHPGKTKA